jgi:SAM-dependent methyltransferase
MQNRHRIQFPQAESSHLNQDQSYFYLQEAGQKQRKIRFHDYNEIYKVPGLYEQLFYERLKCSSPVKVTSILEAAVRQSQDNFSELRVLDLGAGNGMMGEELKKHGVSRLIGVDIIQEAADSTIRDRPGIYDAYYVEDFTYWMLIKKKTSFHGNVIAWLLLRRLVLAIFLLKHSLKLLILSKVKAGSRLILKTVFLTPRMTPVFPE